MQPYSIIWFGLDLRWKKCQICCFVGMIYACRHMVPDCKLYNLQALLAEVYDIFELDCLWRVIFVDIQCLRSCASLTFWKIAEWGNYWSWWLSIFSLWKKLGLNYSKVIISYTLKFVPSLKSNSSGNLKS